MDSWFQCDSKRLIHFEPPKDCSFAFQETREKAFVGIRDHLGGANAPRNSGHPLILVSHYTEAAIAIAV